MEITYTKNGLNDFDKLPIKVQFQVSSKIEKLEKYPEVSGIKNLKKIGLAIQGFELAIID